MSEHVETQAAPAPAVGAPGLDAATATALLQHSASAVALCDAQGRIDWCNRVLLGLCGGAPVDGRGQSLALLLALSEADTQLLEEALGEGRPCQLSDMRVGGPSGSWWRAQISVLPDGRRATHWSSVDELHHQSAEARRLAELLDLASRRLAGQKPDARAASADVDELRLEHRAAKFQKAGFALPVGQQGDAFILSAIVEGSLHAHSPQKGWE